MCNDTVLCFEAFQGIYLTNYPPKPTLLVNPNKFPIKWKTYIPFALVDKVSKTSANKSDGQCLNLWLLLNFD